MLESTDRDKIIGTNAAGKAEVWLEGLKSSKYSGPDPDYDGRGGGIRTRFTPAYENSHFL